MGHLQLKFCFRSSEHVFDPRRKTIRPPYVCGGIFYSKMKAQTDKAGCDVQQYYDSDGKEEEVWKKKTDRGIRCGRIPPS